MGTDQATLPGRKPDPGRTGGDTRVFMGAVLWIARTGAPWRDPVSSTGQALPEVFGNWNTVFKRFRHWVKRDTFKRLFDAVAKDPDMQYGEHQKAGGTQATHGSDLAVLPQTPSVLGATARLAFAHTDPNCPDFLVLPSYARQAVSEERKEAVNGPHGTGIETPAREEVWSVVSLVAKDAP